MQNNLLQWKYYSQIAPLYIVASDKGLIGLFWKKYDCATAKSPDDMPVLAATVKQLDEYFSNQRKIFKIPLHSKGTPFQEKVWNELKKIPYGKTASYKDIAHRIGHPKAFRAVGTANGKNPFSILVPCHRVIAADGSMGGYAGGLDSKDRLLKMEQNNSGN